MRLTGQHRCIGVARSTGRQCERIVRRPNTFCGVCVPSDATTTGDARSARQRSEHDAFAHGDPFSIDGYDDPPTNLDGANPPDPLDEPVTPIPDRLDVGDAVGAPVLVGGADLYDSCTTLVAYHDPDSPAGERILLYARVTPEGEQKIMERITAASEWAIEERDVPVQRTPDAISDHDVHTKVWELTEAVDHCLATGMDRGDWVDTATTDLTAARAALEDAWRAGIPAECKVHYRDALNRVEERLHPNFALPYAEGGRLPRVAEWTETVNETHATKTLVPRGDAALPGALSYQRTHGEYPSVTHGDHGATWDGSWTDAIEREGFPHGPTEWRIDLGDGFTARYRPTTLVDPTKGDYSSMRRLTIAAPPGADPSDVINRLSALGIDNLPMTHRQAEHTYLERCAYAAGVHTTPDVVAARHQITNVSRNDPAALADAVTALRDAVARATGHPDGATLAARPTYDPTPRRDGGNVVWRRFDATPSALHDWQHQGIVHNLTGGSWADVLRHSTYLASTQTRSRLPGNVHGMSSIMDRRTGGASGLFFYRRAATPATSGRRVEYEGPQLDAVLADTTTYSTSGDRFGATNPHSHHYDGPPNRDIATMARHSEIIVENGVDLIARPPTRIVCLHDAERALVINLLLDRGVTHFGDGRPVEDVVVSNRRPRIA